MHYLWILTTHTHEKLTAHDQLYTDVACPLSVQFYSF